MSSKSRKNNLLTIGEMASLTNASIRSLRYYERINILKPAYVSPESGYRYYAFDQVLLISTIMFCVELDIPLVEMKKFIEPDGTLDFRSLVKEGHSIAEKKLRAIKKGMNNIAQIEHQMNLSEQYKNGQIYMRQLPQRNFYVKPCGKSLANIDQIEMLKSFANLPYWNDDSWIDESDEVSEFGILRKHLNGDDMYYYVVRVPKNIKTKTQDMLTIPGGNYFCIQSEESQIEQTAEIFEERLVGSFIAIETELIKARHKVNEPVQELRAIALTPRKLSVSYPLDLE